MTEAPSTAAAAALCVSLIVEGVQDVVLCPGSRSQALALVVAEMERRGLLRLHVRVDERSAGFCALGLARESDRPVVVITTSGTAVANLHPAVLEAHHSLVPLILLTADRPPELRGIRSNQTTEQAHLFGAATRLSVDVPAPTGLPGECLRAQELAARAVAVAAGTVTRNAGPVQLNLAFTEPLSGDLPDLDPLLASFREDRHHAATDPAPAGDPADPRTDSWTLDLREGAVVVAGTGAGPDAERFAHAAGLPLLAEVASGAHFGRELIVNYRELLTDPGCGGRVRRVIVFGHPTLSREIPALIVGADVETTVVAPVGAELYNPGHRVTRFTRAIRVDAPEPGGVLDRSWLGGWVVRDRELLAEHTTAHVSDLAAARETGYRERSDYAKAEVAALREPVTRGMVGESVWRATWPHDRLVLGASRLIRALDGLAPGRNIRVYANRGLAGIDGTLATAMGIAQASQADDQPGVTRVLLGDLAFLHDVGSLLLTPGETRPRIQIFVGNDGGGTIFDDLEVAGSAEARLFDRVMFTPHSAAIESLAAAYGWAYSRAATRGELDRLLTVPVTGPSIVEVPLAR
ncbi:2-succinyl-5-enolpyruvyl-6-hydroxy-3-cyclohexene- 1-carboxylic-acid synthase [Klugiella xanthotipulae]|uniref:2-succinyl-5-enolpyruvyl-6-hydroxy-3-cyclohexene-1-carboxylate synthase n=1 Tax=Klugiella xanthotipulae TaxID=244735 RepID=A0A543HZD5_9MICO|nr:2-succinyl-5-enolpyruvyl-6-hydroxy-3-cyclohexene-1-carboxylic-acid synthase [Klugiella xanthotipulae]TQM63630.1 2-succinyl-5-enolpyruvyl-6-hydroxy-3-cyclohexene-1-carboxylate synthase [Klugiella xanthotipulae]